MLGIRVVLFVEEARDVPPFRIPQIQVRAVAGEPIPPMLLIDSSTSCPSGDVSTIDPAELVNNFPCISENDLFLREHGGDSAKPNSIGWFSLNS